MPVYAAFNQAMQAVENLVYATREPVSRTKMRQAKPEENETYGWHWEIGGIFQRVAEAEKKNDAMRPQYINADWAIRAEFQEFEQIDLFLTINI